MRTKATKRKDYWKPDEQPRYHNQPDSQNEKTVVTPVELRDTVDEVYEYLKEARERGYSESGDWDAFNHGRKTIIASGKDDALQALRAKITALNQKQTEAQRAYDGYNVDKEAQIILDDNVENNLREELRAKEKLAGLKYELGQLILKDEALQEDQGEPDEIVKIAKKQFWFVAVSTVLTTLGVSSVEVATMIDALTRGLDQTLMVSVPIGVSVSVFLGGSSHFMGRALQQNNRLMSGVFGVLTLGLTGVLALIREHSKFDADLLYIFLGMLLVFGALSVVFSYHFYKMKATLRSNHEIETKEEEKQRVRDQRERKKIQFETAEEELENLSGVQKQRALNKAKATKEKLKTGLDNLVDETESAQTRLDKVDLFCASFDKESEEEGRRGFNQGRHQRSPTSVIGKNGIIGLSMLLLMLTGCGTAMDQPKPEERFDYFLFDDKSKTVAHPQNDLLPALNDDVANFCTLEDGEYGRRAIRVKTFQIGSPLIPSETEISIDYGTDYGNTKLRSRSDTFAYFLRRVDTLFRATLTESNLMDRTRFHRGTVWGLNQLARSDALHRKAVIHSDAVEDSSIFDGDGKGFAQDPNLVVAKRDSLINLLLDKVPLTDSLHGIEIVLMWQPKSDTSELALNFAHLFQKMWQDKGAHVEIVRSL